MELFAFILYFVVVIGIGIFFFLRSRSGGEKDYFLGGRSTGPFVTAMSAQASDMSGWLLMGFPGSILAFGMGQAWIGIGLAIGTALNWIFVASRLRRFSKAAGDSITIPQYGNVHCPEDQRPVVFLTSNNYRELSGAMKRRCSYLYIRKFSICFPNRSKISI